MSKKDSERDSLRYLETPTAAFPIGSLGLDGSADDEDEEKTALRSLVRDLDLEEETQRQRPVRVSRTDEHDTEVMVARAAIEHATDETPTSPAGVNPGLLALSLLGGGLLALGVVAVFGMWLL